MNLSDDKMRAMMKTMLTIRAFEQEAQNQFAMGLTPGFVHLYIGEEAVATGACAALKEDDFITSTHRGHGHIIAKGGDVKYMMAELFGEESGYCKGKGGSMHIADASKGILGANGIVGAGHNIAVGAGLSAQYRDSGQVCVCFFGDASTNQSTFHEALNLASVWKLPVIFVCENNGYGISVSQERHQNITDISVRAQSYNIPGVTIDGNDVLAVYEAVFEAVAHARDKKGPTLIECKTYRHRGHFEGDATVYRTEEELMEWKKKDPIPRLKNFLTDNEIMSIEEIDAMEAAIKQEVEDAVVFAKESKVADLASVVHDVYTDIVEEARVR